MFLIVPNWYINYTCKLKFSLSTGSFLQKLETVELGIDEFHDLGMENFGPLFSRKYSNSFRREAGFRDLRRTERSRMTHTCSMGFISGDWLIHGSFLIPCFACQVWVFFSRWHRALSSIKWVDVFYSKSPESIGSRAFSKMSTYFTLLILPSYSTNSDRPVLQMAPHTIRKNPPCLIIGYKWFRSNSGGGVLHMHVRLLEENWANVDSSEKMTDYQKFTSWQSLLFRDSFFHIDLPEVYVLQLFHNSWVYEGIR